MRHLIRDAEENVERSKNIVGAGGEKTEQVCSVESSKSYIASYTPSLCYPSSLFEYSTQ